VPGLNPVAVTVIIVSAAVSYTLGVLLLTIPSRKFRGFGWELVYDAGTVILFLASLPIIPVIVSVAVALLSGGSSNLSAQYQSFYCWLGTGPKCVEPTDVAVIYALYEFVYGALQLFSFLPIVGQATIQLWSAYMGPSLTALSYLNSLRYVFYFLGEMLSNAWWFVVGLGAVLYGLPAKLGRRVGAGLIALILVFYIALPFMPVFVDGVCSGAGTMCQVPAGDADALNLAVSSGNQTLFNPVENQLEILENPNVNFQVTDMKGQNIGPDILKIGNGTLTWVLYTQPNGTRTYGFLSGSYEVNDVLFLNVSSVKYSGGLYQPVPFTAYTAQQEHPQTNVQIQLKHIWEFTTKLETPVMDWNVPGFLLQTSSTMTYKSLQANYQGDNSSTVEFSATGMSLSSHNVWNQATNISTTTFSGVGHAKIFFVNATEITNINFQPPTTDGATITYSKNSTQVGVGDVYDFKFDYTRVVTCYEPSGAACSNDDSAYSSSAVYTLALTVTSGPYPDFSHGTDINPVIVSVFNSIQQTLTTISNDSYIVNSVVAHMLLRRLILPLIYVAILVLVAADIGFFMGGKTPSLPGL
jgi:hypothetical protein